MAKDFFRKRPASMRESSQLPVSGSKETKTIANADINIKLQLPKAMTPKQTGFQNKFKDLMEEQEDKEENEGKNK